MSSLQDLVIRDASAADVARLVELRLAFDAELAGPLPPDRETEHRAQVEVYLGTRIPSGHFRVWVAETATGELVAMAGRVVIDRPPHPRSRRAPEVFVFNVFTMPAWRGMGVARTLMAAVIDEARALRARRVIMRTSDAGRPVYEGLGFHDPGNWLQLDLD